MGRRGPGYGSEDNLLRYRAERPAELDAAILTAISRPGHLKWVYPGAQATEPRDLDFLIFTSQQEQKWRSFWPDPGNRRWDGVATLGSEWLLLEAKANATEFQSPPSGARAESRAQICNALEETKRYMGAQPGADWYRTFYQYANRLAVLYFLNILASIPARLVFVYFIGDRFPDGRPCPQSKDEWDPLIQRCHEALGLSPGYPLVERVHDVFIPALRVAEERTT